jgi:hypothetical protein
LILLDGLIVFDGEDSATIDNASFTDTIIGEESGLIRILLVDTSEGGESGRDEIESFVWSDKMSQREEEHVECPLPGGIIGLRLGLILASSATMLIVHPFSITSLERKSCNGFGSIVFGLLYT